MSSSNKHPVLEFGDELKHGWNIDDFKQIAKTANGKRSESSAARLKSLVQANLAQRIKNTNKESFREKLFRLNPSVSVLKETGQYVQVSMAGNLQLPKLPLGYAFKGGAARVGMLNILGINTRKIFPRDIDLVRIGQNESELDRLLAARYMAEDFKYGHGVELQASIYAYFESRDLTINELFMSGRKMTFSHAAFEDLKAGNIRLSALYRSGRRELKGKLICKMLRLKAELESLGLNGTLELPAKMPQVSLADYKFHFNRVKELGAMAAGRYKQLSEQHLPHLFINKPKAQESTVQGSSVLNLRSELQRFRTHKKKHL